MPSSPPSRAIHEPRWPAGLRFTNTSPIVLFAAEKNGKSVCRVVSRPRADRSHLIAAAPFDNCPLIMLFLFPVIVSAWLGGLGPGLRATGMSAIVFCYFMLAPFHGLVVATEFGALEWILLIFCSLSISLMSEFMLYLRQRRHRLLGGEDGLRQKAKACSGIGPWWGGRWT